jgi:hypothetical protein
VPYFKADLERLGHAIHHPPTWAELKKAGVVGPANVAPDGSPTEDE